MTITLIIIIVTVLISYQGLSRPGILDTLKHHPYREHRDREWYRLITSGFVHGSWMHLGVNMYVFYVFGSNIEQTYEAIFGETMGKINYVVLYVLTIIAGDIPTFFKYRNHPGYASVGASGAVSGILFIYILLYPWSTLSLYFILPIPAILFGVGYLWYSSWAVKNSRDNIDHMAHFYGALFGILFTLALAPETGMVFINQILDIPWL